ncbi:hypothetical protein TNIN_353991 [Trichonephila inaurata madagascariensis]|uniref:Uncharacterized protein n=1 Tax=Trichonephila inaurata madagascariensis TaxID=2747483 RepID=A0A8X6XQR0_9ARAC|nr:hypothetical protein TNIN_353991 [Trichonephila inaurata madagascariensis]
MENTPGLPTGNSIQGRLNLVPLNANKKGIHCQHVACLWKCGQWDETLPHVINHCKSYSAAAVEGTMSSCGPGLRSRSRAILSGKIRLSEIIVFVRTCGGAN